MTKSIFSKIIDGEIPSHKIYEDDKTFCFLDINPVQPGHALVIPKKQVEFLWDLEEEDYLAVMKTAKKIALALRQASEKPFVGQQVVGVDVPHAHVHLIPFEKAEDLKQEPAPKSPAPEKLAKIADKIKEYL